MKITKAVIPCGGIGSRFLPITKSVPKELLPIIDTPVLSYIINEAVDSGVTDIMLILGRDKEAIRHYFTPCPRLEDTLLKQGKKDLYKQITEIYKKANIVFEYQNEPKGSGDALLKAKSFTGAEPFCLAFGDDVINSTVPVLAQLINAYNEVNTHIVGVQYIAGDDITKYGVAKISSALCPEKAFKCEGFIEKPALNQIPSRFAAMGRYVLAPEIYNELLITPLGKNGELQITDAINSLCIKSEVYGYDFSGVRYDLGDKLGAVKATLEYALQREFKDSLLQYLTELIKTFDV